MNLLKTTFYDEFACIGAECPLTCCGGWMIAMEEKTLKDYRMMGGEIGRFARKGVTYNSDLQSYCAKLYYIKEIRNYAVPVQHFHGKQ